MSDPGERRVLLEIDDGLAHLRLAAPERGNAIDPAWVEALGEAVGECERDGAVRAVLISARGPAFSVGGDLSHFAARTGDLSLALDEMVPPYHDALGRLASLSCPVVCAVHGPVAGGGLGLVFCADLVFASTEARFVCGFARLGLSGDGAGTWFLPRLVGLRRAQEMILGNRELSAPEALEWGLVTRLVAADRLEETALAAARELASGPTVALSHMRRLLRESAAATLEQQLKQEADAIIECGGTDDAREGVEAFVAHRVPRFRGR